MELKRILIVDDHPLFREGLKVILRRDPSLVVAAEAGSAGEAVRLAKTARPELALVDISLPDRSGVQLVRELKAMLPAIRILMVSMHAKVDYIVEAVKAGATGYVTKESATERLLEGLTAVAAGGFFLDPAISVEVSRALLTGPAKHESESTAAYDTLTPREREVMRLVVQGLVSKEIADVLAISVKTAEHHRASILRKLGLQNSVELTRYAARLGLID